jgi:hypothetical protein
MKNWLRRWVLAAEAGVELVLMKTLVVLMSPARYSSLLGGQETWPRERLPVVALNELVWAIEAVGRRAPRSINCLPRALALQRMLLRRGTRATVRFGARRVGQEFRAHAWLTLDGHVVLGNLPDLNEYAVFSRWPGGR